MREGSQVMFSVDPLYIATFCIRKWIENYHQNIKEEYSEMKLKLVKDIPNHKARRFADFEYMRKNGIVLEEYDPKFIEELMYVYAEKYEVEVINFDNSKDIGEAVWEHIHKTQEWKDLYNEYLSQGYGDTGMGVYSKSLKKFVPCSFGEHKGAIYEMLRMFDEFKDIDDYGFYQIVNNISEENDSNKEKIERMNFLVMNDFKLVGNKYKNEKTYIE